MAGRINGFSSSPNLKEVGGEGALLPVNIPGTNGNNSTNGEDNEIRMKRTIM